MNEHGNVSRALGTGICVYMTRHRDRKDVCMRGVFEVQGVSCLSRMYESWLTLTEIPYHSIMRIMNDLG